MIKFICASIHTSFHCAYPAIKLAILGMVGTANSDAKGKLKPLSTIFGHGCLPSSTRSNVPPARNRTRCQMLPQHRATAPQPTPPPGEKCKVKLKQPIVRPRHSPSLQLSFLTLVVRMESHPYCTLVAYMQMEYRRCASSLIQIQNKKELRYKFSLNAKFI